MITYNRGLFGVLNLDDMEEQPLVLLDGGIERRCQEEYDFRNDCRSGYEGYLFQYTLKGQGVFERGGEVYPVAKGCGFLVEFPEKSRYYLPRKENCEWEFLYLHFTGDAARPFAEKLRRILPEVFPLEEESRPIRMALKLQQRLTKGERLRNYEGGEFLYSFLCELLREAEHPGTQRKSPCVQNAAELMEREYRGIAGVEALAEKLEVSPAHLSRIFKTEMGISPLSYLTRLRLQSAMNDLLGTEESVDQIARRNGFSSGNYFSKIFRKHVGLSPGRYREINRWEQKG